MADATLQNGVISVTGGRPKQREFKFSVMINPTPTANSGLPKRHADFRTIAEALDYAALGATGINFYDARLVIVEALPYRTLREQALLLARKMLGAGLQPGERVGLIAENDGDFTRAFYACQYAGLIPAPLPLPAAFGGRQNYIAHLRRMLDTARASALIGPGVLAAWLTETAAGLDLKFTGTVEMLTPVTGIGGELPPQDENALGYLQFSSGSTRFPAGIAVTQRAFMANARGIGKHGLAIAEGDRAASWLPFYHDMGLVGFFLLPMACQSTVDILSPRDFARRPLNWLNLISNNRVTTAFSPSFGYELCTRRAETVDLSELDLSSWRSAGIGGDMIRPSVLENFIARFGQHGFSASAFVPSYGMAEATLALSFTPPGRGAQQDVVDSTLLESDHLAAPLRDPASRARSFVRCGYPLPGHEIEVRDAAGTRLGERHVGQVFARGPSLMQGYFGAPEETARVMSADGWLDTGDLGFFANGEIVISGRAKDLIIVNGRNLWPQDLEWTAEAELDLLRSNDVAVFSVEGQTDEVVVALAQCRAGEPAERDALAAEIGNIFRARFGVEARIVLVPPHSLPLTSSGKLSRSRARATYLAGGFLDLRDTVAADEAAE
jgi:fatty-acyl-CoA synthase